MRHTFFILAASAFLSVLAGCACNIAVSCRRQWPAAGTAASGPPQQQAGRAGWPVSYPYYTAADRATSWKHIRKVLVRDLIRGFHLRYAP